METAQEAELAPGRPGSGNRGGFWAKRLEKGKPRALGRVGELENRREKGRRAKS